MTKLAFHHMLRRYAHDLGQVESLWVFICLLPPPRFLSGANNLLLR
jgi:hypothetical protein